MRTFKALRGIGSAARRRLMHGASTLALGVPGSSWAARLQERDHETARGRRCGARLRWTFAAVLAGVGLGTPATATATTTTAISGGGFHTCALSSAGGVKCWGNDEYGELGDGTTTNKTTPVDVSGLTSGVSAISAGELSHVRADERRRGQVLGRKRLRPARRRDDRRQHDAGRRQRPEQRRHRDQRRRRAHVRADERRRRQVLGRQRIGELGDGTTTSRSTPVAVSGLSSGVTAISGGGYHTCALTSAGGVKCWGYNAQGQLGDGTTESRTDAGRRQRPDQRRHRDQRRHAITRAR